MSRYAIRPGETGIAIDLTGTGDRQDALLAAFGECQAGACSCPTDEYEKVEAMDLRPESDAIHVELRAKPGTEFDVSEIAACLHHTVGKAGS